MEGQIKRKGADAVMKRNWQDGIEYLTFPNLEGQEGIRHLFTTRIGGISRGDYATMNFSYTRGDEKAAVDENFKRIAKVLGRSVEDFVLSDQTHTANIRIVTGEDAGKGIVRKKDYHDIDGMVTNVPRVVLAAFFADCVPLYFVDPANRAIGLSHAGWKGTAAGIGKRTVACMQETYGSDPKQMLAAIGPSICGSCYEVGEEVAGQFFRLFPDAKKAAAILRPAPLSLESAEKKEKKYLLDLWRANYEMLLEAGMLPAHLCVTDLCTCCNAGYLFSHRASKGRRGNLGAFLSIG